jgi:hypothetical protein
MLASRSTNTTTSSDAGSSNSRRRNRHGRGSGRGPNSGRSISTSTSTPSGGRGERTPTQVGLNLAQINDHFPNGIPDHLVLLDSDSTVSIFCNADLLTDIHDVDESLVLVTNGGTQISTQKGMLPNFGPVWFNPNSIANVLSLAQVRSVRRVTMDSHISPAFHVHKSDGSGTTTVFSEHPSGLYLFDTLAPIITHAPNNNINHPLVEFSCLQTVADNKSNFTRRQIEAADAARALYRHLGRPGYSRFLTALQENHILNCPVTVDDARRAELIYGKDVAFLKGKNYCSACYRSHP